MKNRLESDDMFMDSFQSISLTISIKHKRIREYVQIQSLIYSFISLTYVKRQFILNWWVEFEMMTVHNAISQTYWIGVFR